MHVRAFSRLFSFVLDVRGIKGCTNYRTQTKKSVLMRSGHKNKASVAKRHS